MRAFQAMMVRAPAACRLGAVLVALLFHPTIVSAVEIDFGRYHALLISNTDYKYWSDLTTPHKDVAALDQLLREKYGFRTTILKDATRADIIDELENLKQRLSERDNLLIYYAGHGTVAQEGGYWVGADAR